MLDWRNLEAKLGLKFTQHKSLSGGDISSVYQMKTDHSTYVLKVNQVSLREMFEVEKRGMELLQSSNSFIIPEIVDIGILDDQAYLLMEYVKEGSKDISTFENFGKNLAQLHAQSHSHFGLDHNNFIGALAQSNRKHERWESFYLYERIKPQIDLAQQRNYLTSNEVPKDEVILNVAKEIFCSASPSLLHGDLWNGNFLVTENGEVALIDPAVYYGHPMMDIGMTKLFGGFEDTFYTSYFKHAKITGDFEAQIDLAQLYYLLVHLNLFGTGYKSQVIRIINTYF